MANEVATIETRATQLAEKIEVLVTEARQKVASVANTAQVYTYYEIGRYIVEDEQGGKVRAEYGKRVLKRVSEHLTERLGKGWSEENLRLMRKFYTLYSHWQSPINKIQTNGLEIQSPKIQTTGSEIQSENSNHRLRNHQFVLPWAHYLILLPGLKAYARQHEWLTEKYGEGEYKDVLGLCKIVTIQEIEEKNYSLTMGAYVGVAEAEDDGVNFHERMNEIHVELKRLNNEAKVLMDEKQKAWEEMK